MDLHSLVEASIKDTVASLWPPFAPELILCASILCLLLIRLFPFGKRLDAGYLTIFGLTLALYFGAPWTTISSVNMGHRSPEELVDPNASLLNDPTITPAELFGGMIVYDTFTVSIRAILLFFTIIFVVFTKFSGRPAREDGTDVYCLILGAVLGMCLMASANHLLMVFLAVEMASVPSYVLAGIMRGRRPASEAALKYSVYGAGAAGVMLYGISLLAGIVNTAHIPTIAIILANTRHLMEPSEQMVLVLAAMMIMVGLAFKLAAVPFHFWCPDVFEGATAEVAVFLSVASKVAALALLVRVSLGVGMLAPPERAASPHADVQAANVSSARDTIGLFAVDDEQRTKDAESATQVGVSTDRDGNDALEPIRKFAGLMIGFIAVITITFGNLAAYGQTNLKRLMAYSTIAHAGFMMLAVPAALAVATVAPHSARDAIGSIVIYIAIYLFMNLTVFAIIAFLRNSLGTEEISDFSGLIRRSPVIVICLALCMFSLVGLPPLAGFVGKFAVFASLADTYTITGQTHLIFLLIVGGVNTAVSLFYYLRVVKVMTMEPESDVLSAYPQSVMGILPATFVVLVTAPVALMIFNWSLLSRWSTAAAEQLFVYLG